MRFRSLDGRYATFDTEVSAVPGRICMNIDYWPDLNRRKRRSPAAVLRAYTYRVKRFILKTPAPVNTMTGPT